MSEPQEPTGIDVSPEFIEENKAIKLCRTSQKSGGPYSKGERAKRRKEVYRLHFEVGLSAVQIAEHMKLNRNTINSDIQLLYRDLVKDSPADYTDYYNKMEARLEAQKQRILGYLKNANNVQEMVAIERLAKDIDALLLTTRTKVEFNSLSFWDKVKETYNRIAVAKGLDYRITTVFELIKISTLARKDLDEMWGKFGKSYKRQKEEANA